jgi:hypothetical protein
MRNELEEIEQIEKYLTGVLSASERMEFEKRMNEDSAFRAAVENQKLIVGGVSRYAVKQEIITAENSFFMKTKITKWGWGGAAFISVTLVVVLVGKSIGWWNSPVPFVQPPLPGVTIAYTYYNVGASAGGEFVYETGTKILVPRNSFLDKDGNPVMGEVQLQYREFRDPVDFFLSGIPMQYDSAGVTYEFESAGMFEMNAFQDGEPLTMNPSSPIKVQMESEGDLSRFNAYYLDSMAHNWAYKGKLELTEIGSAQAAPAISEMAMTDSTAAGMDSSAYINSEKELKDIRKELTKLEEHKPMVPKKLDESKYNFNIEVEASEFPELGMYRGMRFEVTDENKGFTSAMYQTVWEDVSISVNKPGVNYLILLVKGTEKHPVVVVPVLKGKEYERAVKEFDSKLSAYNGIRASRKAAELAAADKFSAEQKKKEQALKWRNAYALTNKMLQTFVVDGFGYWNSDCPIRMPKGGMLAVTLQNDNGVEMKNVDCYLVDKSMNALFHYYPHTLSRFEFDPASQNTLWALGNDGIYIFSAKDFSKLHQVTGACTLNLKKVNNAINSKEDLMRALGM